LKETNEKAPKVADKVAGEYNGKKVYIGPRGGKYYINSNGNKTYIQE
jgi:colicin import membrane protein